jgi:hypothetical protein
LWLLLGGHKGRPYNSFHVEFFPTAKSPISGILICFAQLLRMDEGGGEWRVVLIDGTF